MVVEPEPQNIPPAPKDFERLFELELEKADVTRAQRRAAYYVYLRREENFSREELAELDKVPLSQLQVESRRLLVRRLQNAKSTPFEEGEGEDSGPPWVPRVAPSDPTELPWRNHEQEKLAETAKNPSLSRRTREKARREWIKGQGGGRRVPRARV